MGDDVGRARADLGEAEDLLDRDALPVGVELRPAGDAVDVGVDGLARQRLELPPGQGERRVDLAPDPEVPRREVGLRHRAVVEDRELVGLVLAGRDPLRDRGIRGGRSEEAFEHRAAPCVLCWRDRCHIAGRGRCRLDDEPACATLCAWFRPIQRPGRTPTPCAPAGSSSSCPPTTRPGRWSERTPTSRTTASTRSSSSTTCPSDETVEIAKQLGLDVIIHRQNLGYGGNQKTCYDAALAAGADVVVMLHPDYQYDATRIPALIEPILRGEADLMLGSRFLGDPLAGGMPRWKYVSNRFLTILENLAFGLHLSEYHTGLRAYSRRLLETIPYRLNSDDFVFDQELVAQVVAAGRPAGSARSPSRRATSRRPARSTSGGASSTASRRSGSCSATSSTGPGSAARAKLTRAAVRPRPRPRPERRDVSVRA